MPDIDRNPNLTRRALIGAGAAGILGSAGIYAVPRLLNDGSTPDPRLVLPDSARVRAVEAQRSKSGATVRRTLTAKKSLVDLGGKTVDTWTYNDALPGPPIRVNVGDRLKVSVANQLPDPTTVHWHGLALRNDMDGVPDITQSAIAAGSTFAYDFIAPHPGTYWFHPHVGVQLDTGLVAPLIVEDPNENAPYDDDVVLVLDDWTDGWGKSPEAIFKDFQANGMGGMGGMGGMDDMSMSDSESPSDMGGMGGMGGMDGGVSAAKPLGNDTGDVRYPAHLINGRLPSAPFVMRSQPGRRTRLRIINAASDTAYRFAIGGHRLHVTHADGYPVRPVDVDCLILGMGERYDLVVTASDGTFPVVASPEGKADIAARAILTTSPGKPASGSAQPSELKGRLLNYADLIAADDVALGLSSIDREHTMTLTMGHGGRQWLINGKVFDEREPLPIREGENVRVTMVNKSMMFHPMHLHGHTFAVSSHQGAGVRKDTVNVLPMSKLVIDFVADNPGQWLSHCHNVYHGELGMMTVFSYVR